MNEMQSNVMNRHGSSNAMFNLKSTHNKAANCSSMIPLPIFKNVTITPVSKVPEDSSRGIVPTLCQTNKQFVSSNVKISKGITINSYNTGENDLIFKLKRLPDITINVVQPQLVFKVPEIPKLSPLTVNTSNSKSKTILNRDLLLQRADKIMDKQENSIKFDGVEKISNINLNSKKQSIHNKNPNQKLINNISPLTQNNFNKIASKSLEEIPNKYKFSETLAYKRTTSSPNMLFKNSKSFPKNNSKDLKTIKAAKEIPITFTISQEVKTISNNDFILNDTEKKLLVNEDELFVDLSREDQSSLYSLNEDYDNFVLGLYKSSEELSSTLSEVSQLDSIQETASMDTLKTCELLSNSVQGSFDVKSAEHTNGIKRLQPQNELENSNKKQKLIDIIEIM